MKEKVIIDTDIGDDIDDALAIAFALQAQNLDIIGITTVFRNTRARARIVRRMLSLANKQDIPVTVGERMPLAFRPIDTLFKQVNPDELPGQYADDMDDELLLDQRTAVEFLLETLTESTELISIIAIGPLTNIGRLLRDYPEVKHKINKIVIMGGAYNMNMSEYNILCDPEAAKIVFESGVELVGVGLDVTGNCQLSEENVLSIKQQGSPMCDFLTVLIERFRSYSNHLPYLHDAIAVMVAFDESVVKIENKRIAIETEGQYTRGMTFNISNSRWWEDKNADCNIRVCVEIDKEKFMRRFLDDILSYK